jgi:alpha-2-macroglobulin
MRRTLLLITVFMLLSVSVVPSMVAQDSPTPSPSTETLRVTDVLPRDGTEGVATDALITVIFNRPIVPLVIAEEAADLPSPITITPEVFGQGEWINTSIYVFRPDPTLAGGTTYTVTVNPDVIAQDGATLSEPVAWSFQSLDPAVSEVIPQALDTDVPLTSGVQVIFNQPMERASVEANFRLRADETSVTGSFDWELDGRGFRFVPDQPLQMDTVYEALVPAGTRAGVGESVLADDVRWSFATVLFPAIISTSPRDGESAVYPYGSMTIYFASPMDIETLAELITIEPEPWREAEFYYSTYDNSYNVNFPVEPSTDYTVTIAPGMTDIYGNTIAESRVIRFSTAAYEPTVFLNTPGDIGFYNANNDVTRLYLQHRNVSRLDMSLYQVPVIPLIQTMAVSAYDVIYSSTANYELLRRWQLAVESNLNQNQYQLLNLSEAAQAASCPGAPESRLQVGDVAIVVSEPDGVRARSSAPDGEVLETLYRDYQLPVTDGPVCANGLLWWEVRLRDERAAWVAEAIITDGAPEYLLDVRIAAQTTEVTPLTTETGALPPGVYRLDVTTPETQNLGYGTISHLMVVGTVNLTMKNAIDQVLVWATSVQTGQALADVSVTLYQGDTVLAEIRTDADGFVQFDIPRMDDLNEPVFALVQTETDFGLGYIHWSDGIDPYQFGLNANFYPERYRAYLYSDRPIYRPDQPVYFRGVVRTQDDIAYTVPDFDDIQVVITDPNGSTVYDQRVSITEFGTFSGQFDIADDAPLGYYGIEAIMPSDDLNGYAPRGFLNFGVAEYRLPEFQVNLTADSAAMVQGETIQLTLDSRYFFGGAVSNAQVEYNVVSSAYRFDYTGRGFYDFEDYNYDEGPSFYYGGYSEPFASGTGTTDAQGRLTIELPAVLEDSTQSLEYTIEAVVTDESQQIVAGRATVIVHKGELYIGARPRNYVATVGEETAVDVIAVDWESNPIANQAIAVEVVERRWSNVQEQDEAGRTTWTWEVESIPVTTGELTTDAQGQAAYSFTPPNGGIFQVRIQTQDARGNTVVASTTLWVAGQEYVSWRQQNSNRIDLVSDQQRYAIGDTADILITSPFQGTAEALITVERGSVLSFERITLDTNSTVYELPITAAFAPNVYVSVLIIKGVDETNPVAAFRAGLVNLQVDNAQKELTITLEPDVEQAGPGDTVTYTVRTTDYTGQAVQAEVGVGLTDLASLSIADANSGRLLDFFYGPQALGVRTSTPLTINVDQLTQTILDTIKGGGGGGGEGGIFDIRQEFVDTAYWNATLTTDDEGVARFTVTLPDNLTTWRLDARAVTRALDGDLLVGQQTVDLLSTKPLLIRPVTPRFAIVGDQVTLAAIVNNNTGADMQVQVSLEGTGIDFASTALQTVTIAEGGRARIEWTGTVQDVQNLDLTFFANGNDGAFTDASKPPLGQGSSQLLPVYRYEVPETVGTAGVLRESGSITESIMLPTAFPVSAGELTVSLDPSLAATTVDGLDYLRNFPHQCIEQTVSRFLPNIITYRALDQLGLANEDLRSNLQAAVNFALQRLYAQQKADGGWGWFVQDPSNALTTAYALIGLVEARDTGFPVDNNVIFAAQRFLQSTLIVPGLNTDTWRLNRQAFVLYALARSGSGDVARTANLFEVRQRLDYYAQAFLALAFNFIDPADTSRSDTLLSDLVSAATLSATGASWQEAQRDYWNWNSDTRTTAIVLGALIKLDSDNALLPNVVRWLVSARTADAWETTQETAWAVMSLTDWMVVTGELQPDYRFQAALNGDVLGEGQATAETVRDSLDLRVQVADLLRDEANQIVIQRGEGNGALYYTAHLNVSLPVPEVEPLNNGIIIQRVYALPNEESAVTEAQVGDVVQVRLTIIVPNDLHYVVIEDPIPAGTEAINPNLNTEQQIGTQPEVSVDNPLSQGWGWWWFSNTEFRDEQVNLYATYLPAGTYEYQYSIRAGLPGTYNVIPPTGYEFYFPEVNGRGAGSIFTVLPAA